MMNNKIEAIREFAKKMGYETFEEEYTHYENGRPCYMIELVGTSDSMGERYNWAWYTDTEEEL